MLDALPLCSKLGLGLDARPNCVIAIAVKSCTYCCCQMRDINSMSMKNASAPNKRNSVCNDWDLEPLDLLNGLALGYYQRSPEVLIVYCLHILFWVYLLMDRCCLPSYFFFLIYSLTYDFTFVLNILLLTLFLESL